MKIIITIFIIIGGLFAWGIVHDSRGYARIHEFTEKCNAKGGVATQVQTGLSTVTIQCTVEI